MDTFKKRSSKSRNTSPGINAENFICEIILLDPTQANYIVAVNMNDNGNVLFERVCMYLGGILEKDYFGLRYLDKHGQRQWLELNKPIYKQVRDKNHHKSTQLFSFRFKHYPKYPCEDLKQELSRYLLYLQLRRDLYRCRLVGSSIEQYHMAALILQAELGDFEIEDAENSINISDLKILPRLNRKSEMKIFNIHETLREMNPKEAEKKFLEEASKLQTYGVEPVPVKDQKGNDLFVGVVEEGISTFNGSKRAHTFPWQHILKLSYSHKMFMFQVATDQRKHILGFKCESTHAACALWKWALDRKCFFTLEKGSLARRSRSGGSLFRKKKCHIFTGMSQKELTQSCENLQVIPQPHVTRSISSRNESTCYSDNFLSNGIDLSEKVYSTLPRSHGMNSLFSDLNEDSEKLNRKINKTTSQKPKSPSAAVGAVLDFMQALKETPILKRLSSSNLYSELHNEEDDISPENEKEDSDSNVVSEMIEIVNEQRSSMSLEEPSSTQMSNCCSKTISDTEDIKNSNFQMSFIMISLFMLLVPIIYGFVIIFHVHSTDHSDYVPSEHSQITSVFGWLSRILSYLIFDNVENEQN